jgi:SNF2 family DNA or RNA helicase
MSQVFKSSTAFDSAVEPIRSSDKPISKKPSVALRQGRDASFMSRSSSTSTTTASADSIADRRAVFMRDLEVLSEISRDSRAGAGYSGSNDNQHKSSSRATHPQTSTQAVLPRSWEDFRSAYFPDALYASLYPHQRDGVRWLYELHGSRHRGGILADDMGLGKTKQVNYESNHICIYVDMLC